MARLDHFREITLFTENHLDPRKAALAFAGEAKRLLDEMVAAKRVPAKYRRFVDGREGAPFEAVRPGGTIAAQFAYTADVLLFALAFLRARGPSGGGFRDSFWIGIDGKYVAPGALNPERVPGGPVELTIGSTKPWNRKATVQTAGGRKLNFSVPPWMWHDCAKAVNARFGNTVVARAVRDVDWPGKPRLRRGQARKRAGDFVESPAVVISPRR